MVHIIIRRSEREVRERAGEAPARYRRAGITGYARDIEEAERIQKERGLDNPNSGYMLVDDGGKANEEGQRRALRAAGLEASDE